MCECCGCQEIATIGELTREHDAVVAEIAIVRRCVSESDLEAAARSAARIAEILRPHTSVEEHGPFPAALTTLDAADWVRIEQVRASVGSLVDPEPQHLIH
jgi:hypothetical protein